MLVIDAAVFSQEQATNSHGSYKTCHYINKGTSSLQFTTVCVILYLIKLLPLCLPVVLSMAEFDDTMCYYDNGQLLHMLTHRPELQFGRLPAHTLIRTSWNMIILSKTISKP